jgi:phage I-like protein
MSLKYEVLSIDVEPGKEPPKEFRLFKMGDNPSTKGTFVFDEDSVRLTKEYYEKHGPARLMVDYEHKSLDSNAPIAERKASARFSPEWRQDGLYATQVKWTPMATQEIVDGERNCFSPAFGHKDGHIRKLVNVALCNLPALDNVELLVAASELCDEPLSDVSGLGAADAAKEIDQMKSLITLLGVETEEAGIKELTSLQSEKKLLEEQRDELILLSGADSFESASGTIAAGVKAIGRVKELEAIEAKREEEAKVAKLNELVEKGRSECKLSAAQEEWARTLTVDTLSAFLENAPKIIPSADEAKSQPGSTNSNGAAVLHDGKGWKDLSSAEKHNLKFAQPEVYAALRDDHIKATTSV